MRTLRASTLRLVILCLATLAAPAGPGRAEQRFREVTPWLRTERVEPWLTFPHLLELGPRERVEVLRDGAWRQVYRGRGAYPKVLEGGRAVFLQDAGELHRAGVPEVLRFPEEPCGGFAWGHIVIPLGLELVACVRASAEDGCLRLEISQYDLSGRLLRRDALGAAAVCADRPPFFGPPTYAFRGLADGGDPVVVVQVGLEQDRRPRYRVFRLTPAGPALLGDLTGNLGRLVPGVYAWPPPLAAAVAHPAN